MFFPLLIISIILIHWIFTFIEQGCNGHTNFVSQSGFESLKIAGLNIVLSDTIRQEIINLFENTYSRMHENIRLFKPFDLNLRKYTDENFVLIPSPDLDDRLVPLNYEEFIEDHYYPAIVVRLLDERFFLPNAKCQMANGLSGRIA